MRRTATDKGHTAYHSPLQLGKPVASYNWVLLVTVAFGGFCSAVVVIFFWLVSLDAPDSNTD